jgi:acyl-CoA thioester hydrolase
VSTPNPTADGIFRHRFTVPDDAIDGNGHVNNVVYLQWMQDVATRHAETVGGTAAAHAVGGTWVVRSHQVEYLSPAYAGDGIEAVTWVADMHHVRSRRQYRFVRFADGKLIARGGTDWVFVAADTGRPCAIPESVRRCYTVRDNAR